MSAGTCSASSEPRGIEWRPLLRSNGTDLDPLYFGIYGDVVYHHGAGFRIPKPAACSRPIARTYCSRPPPPVPRPGCHSSVGSSDRCATGTPTSASASRCLQLVLEDADQADDVYRAIETDNDFFRIFQEPGISR